MLLRIPEEAPPSQTPRCAAIARVQAPLDRLINPLSTVGASLEARISASAKGYWAYVRAGYAAT